MALHAEAIGARVSSRIFSLGRKLQRKPSPWSLFFCVQGGTLLAAHSYAKKEGLGMRLFQSLEFPHMPSYTQSH